jgi:hypothetical protein
MSAASALAKLKANKPITIEEAREIVGAQGGPSYGGWEAPLETSITGSGGGGGGSTLGGLGGFLKDVGHGALNALATPGNALVTTAGNVGLTLAGEERMPWRNALGAFHGVSPGSELLGRLGVSEGTGRMLGGLGVDILADPLWLLGAGKIARVAKAGDDIAGKVGTSLARVADVTRPRAPGTGLARRTEVGPVRSQLPARSEGPTVTGGADVPRLDPIDTRITTDGVVTPKTVREQMRALRSFYTKELTDPQEFAVRVGFGRLGRNTKTSRTFRTGIPARRRSLALGKTGAAAGDVLNRRFTKTPLQKISRRLKVAAQDTQRGIEQATLNVARQLGLDTVDANRIGVYLAARRASANAGAATLEHMIQRGHWKPEYDRAIDLFDEQYGLMSKDLGHYTAADLPRLQEEIEGHILRGEDERALLKAHIVENLTGRPYAPHGRHPEASGALREWIANLKVVQDPLTGGKIPGANPFKERELPHAFAGMSRDDAVQQFVDELGLTQREAEDLADVMGAAIERNTGNQAFADATFEYRDPVTQDLIANYKPNLDAFDLFSKRASAQVQKVLDDQVEGLVREAGVLARDFEDVKRLLTQSVDSRKIHGSMSSGALVQRIQKATGYLKMMFTTMLPAHYVRNAVGDFVNDMVNGNLRHVATGPQFGVGQYAKLIRSFRGAKGSDERLLRQTFRVGEREYSGAELLAMARLSSVGVGVKASHGFVGEDILSVIDLAANSRNPVTKYFHFMQQMNVDRENAQRLRTWVRHMQGGDDMFTAAAKTIRTKFDYGDLTNFERVWMRNLMLFYTWFRNNTPLHIGGLVTRPGLYASAGQMEAAREKFVNEPGYFKHLGLAPSLVGNFAFGNPISDSLNKLRLSEKGLRESTIGQLTPFLQVPTGLASGANPVTGQPFADRPVGSIWGRLPLVGSTSSAYAGGPSGPSINSKIAYILNSVSPGPLWAANAVTTPGYEGSAKLDLLGRLSGLRLMQDQPEKFAAIAKIRKREEESQKRSLRRYNVE